MIETKTLTPKEVAGVLGCHVDFVLKEIKLRRMRPVFRVNQRVIRIPESTVEKYRAGRVV
jgi:excisionase family DNA binding protein